MKKTLTRKLTDIWYKDMFIGSWLMPLGFIFSDITRFRKFLYRHNIGRFKTERLPVPVIIVGNITVGGTGKTPLIIALANVLKAQGFKVGIISRGYGGDEVPRWVTVNSDPKQVGDEALLIAKQTDCPMAVAPLRVEAGKLLLEHADCNVILSDDGLQHYALHRDIEIAVIDGERRFGNSYCLPAGPLREPIHRLQSVDFIVVNGEKTEANELEMHITGDTAVNLVTGEHKPLSAFATENTLHAVAGIGNPDRFFKLLTAAGLTFTAHSFPDHYTFLPRDIDFKTTVLMTEKDAVKCTDFATAQHWFVPVNATLDPKFTEQLLTLLEKKYDR
ncbi:tetraacyldisaccharide 4'-kinase [Crenothrix sp. D3]|nr:tetraacyldisaccharide 4'-kinase [Crenothrix sp. D3]